MKPHTHCRLLDFLAILDVIPLNLFEIASVLTVDGYKSSDNGEFFGCIDLKAVSAAVELFAAASVGIETASAGIALAVLTRMCSVNGGQTVRLPNVHFVARFAAGLNLGVTVAGTVGGSRETGIGPSPVFVHGNEIEGGIHTATDCAHVDFEREFLVEQVEHLISTK